MSPAASSRNPRPPNDVFIALLRGVNVGGKNLLPMKQLVALFHEVGCQDAQAYIQSGNVIFRAPRSLAQRVPQLLAARIAEDFHLSVPLVLRSASELARVVQRNPYLLQGVDPGTLHVGFLAGRPSPAQRSALDSNRSLPDQFTLRGRDIYFRFPNGLARTKLTNAYFDSKLQTVCTVRNWKTVLKLLELARG